MPTSAIGTWTATDPARVGRPTAYAPPNAPPIHAERLHAARDHDRGCDHRHPGRRRDAESWRNRQGQWAPAGTRPTLGAHCIRAGTRRHADTRIWHPLRTAWLPFRVLRQSIDALDTRDRR